MPAAKKPRRSARPGGLAHGRWLGDFPDLSAAELRLVECYARGDVWKPEGWDPDKSERPTKQSDANTIRAELIRFLMLGGDDFNPIHENGVVLKGGWIDEELALFQVQTTLRLFAHKCYFAKAPVLMGARLPELALCGSQCPGLVAGGLQLVGNLYLNEGFHATGEVRLLGAEIGGDLNCQGGQFDNAGDVALHADSAIIKGSVFLRDGFHATGLVRLLGAEIGGELDCSGGRFDNLGGMAIEAHAANVMGRLHLRDTNSKQKILVNGAIGLVFAQVGTLDDRANLSCWQGGRHLLDGFRYRGISGFTDAEQRIAWLKLQREDHLSTNFKPQPWEQLIKVLREMGHGYEAGEIAMAKQDHMRKVGIIKGPLRRGFHWLYGLLAGYGHRPVRTVAAMLTVWLACAFFFQIGGNYGYVGPGTPLLNNADLAHDVAEQCGHRFETGKTVWTRCPAMPAEYTTFQPLLYSLDLILPLVDLQQDTDWAPIVEDPPGNNLGYGVFLRWLMWFEILFGWAMSLMLVAVLGRLVEKD